MSALLLTLNTSLSHSDTTSADTGNAKLFMRGKAVVKGVVRTLPIVSGNAIRHALIRETLANHLLRALDIRPAEAGKGPLPQGVVTLLYSGGNMSESAPGDALALTEAIRTNYPMLDLLGGACDGFLLGKSRLNLCCWIVGRENNAYTERYGVTADYSLLDLLGDEGRTTFRAGMAAQYGGLVGRPKDEKKGMPYQYETLAAGAQILVECSLDPWTPELTKSALGTAIAHFGGYLCGQNRQGHGRVALEPLGELPSPEPYESYLAANAERLSEGLRKGTLGTNKVVVG